MYARVPLEQAHPNDPAHEFQHVSTEYLDPNSREHKAHPRVSENSYSSDPSSVLMDQRAGGSSTYEQDGKSAPTTLKRTAFRQWFSTFFDTLLSLIPLFFLVIAALCLALNGQPVSSYGEKIKAITLVSPTIFPIIYAAILGKALRRIGLYYAERSVTIGTLEQLIGSQSFFTGIERQFGLRRFNILGVAIITAWLLSPLGGQASLRLLSTKLREIPTTTSVGYHAFETHDNFSHIGQATLEEYYWQSYGPTFLTALQTARYNLNEPRDFFSNIKIPDMATLGAVNETSGWYDVAQTSSPIYTSLIGIPIADIPSSGNVSFVVESAYWELRCKRFGSNFTLERINNTDLEYNIRKIQWGVEGPSFGLNASLGRWTNDTSFTFDYLSKLSRTTAMPAPCVAGLRVVESEISCKSAVCGVDRMRNSKRNATILIDQKMTRGPRISFLKLCLFLPGSDLGPKNYGTKSSELIEQWILDPGLQHEMKNWDSWNGIDLSTVPTEIFNHRLQMVFNTFWESLMGVNYLVANSTTIQANDTIPPWNTTTATGMRYDGEQYVCNKIFAAITIVISFLLFMTASAAGVLGFFTKAPDILGFMSTHARDNPYFKEHVPSYMDGLEAARVLRDVRVMVGDVHKMEDVGHVAFASADVEATRISSNRLYD